MKFATTAKEIQAACKAGMTLVGTQGNNSPMWHGTPEQLSKYLDLIYGN